MHDSTSFKLYHLARLIVILNILRLADKYQQISKDAQSNTDHYLGHPVNQYRLVKRLASEWTEMEELVLEDVTSSKYILNVDESCITF